MKKIDINKIQNLATPRKIASVSTMLILLAAIGVFQFIQLGASFDVFFKLDFYVTLFYRMIIMILAYSMMLDFLFDRCYKHPNITSAYNKFKELSKNIDINFEEFIELKNKENKKRAWIEKQNLRLSKIEKKLIDAIDERSKRKYQSQIEEIKVLLTDEYIDDKIDFLEVNYYRMLPSDFTSGSAIDNFEEFTVKTRVDYNSEKAVAMIKKMLPFVLTSIIMGMTVFGALNKQPLEVITGLIMDLALISIRIGQGIFDAQPLVDASYLVPYTVRVNVLMEYIEWSKDKPKTKAFKLVNYIENLEEQSEEQNESTRE